MHISLTPELEARIKSKVESGLYNNASEVIREALRFMETNEELIGFFFKLGYDFLGRLPHHFGPDQNGMRLVKTFHVLREETTEPVISG